MPDYQLSAPAKEDLRQIARYTLKKWGPAQLTHYQGLLDACFIKIGREGIQPKTFLDHRPDLLFTRCEHHYVFYILRSGQSPLIVAVFHENMDLISRIKNRLRA